MDRDRTGLLFGVERADALVRRKRTSPASNILAFGSSRASRTFPRRNILRSGCRPIRLGDAAPRLQWRHRVGLAPTSRDRRAEPVNATSPARASVVRRVYRTGPARTPRGRASLGGRASAQYLKPTLPPKGGS